MEYRAWSRDEYDLVRSLWEKSGKSVREIAETVGRSRNSIIGFARRCCLTKRRRDNKIFMLERINVTRVQTSVWSEYVSKPKDPLVIKPIKPRVVTKGIPFSDRKANQCAFIIGDPKALRCCGHDVYKRDYCETHYKRCYQ